MRILHLTLKKKWFDMIASGEKKEEYREIKPYWESRLMEFDIVSRNSFSSFKNPTGFKHFDTIEFKNGYGKNAPKLRVQFMGTVIRVGRREWGAEPGKEYFVIKLGELLTTPQGE